MPFPLRSFIAVCASIIVSSACARDSGSDAAATAATDSIPVITEAWVSAIDTIDNVDSPTFWFSADGPRVIATAKATDVLIVYDAVTGAALQRIGGPGTGEGQLERPNGLVVLGDSVLLVVERDNHRVQAFALPDFRSFGSFGASDLIKPYGIAAYEPQPGRWHVYVTDNYETADEQVPPLAELGRRVKRYEVALRNGRAQATLLGAFGDTTAAGAIRITESIQLDPARGLLVLAEEDESDTQVKEYTLDGTFTGRSFGKGVFTQQAEGIALWTCGDSAGYWVTTDQGPVVNTFHLFDRVTLAHVGAFRGRVTNTTDGVALTQRGVGPFTDGLFATAHFDAAVSAFAWSEMAGAAKATARCALP